MNEIQLRIQKNLKEMEQERNIRIPLAVESGSRAWGFASPDSDYDCRFIYVHPKDRYLSVFANKDTITLVPDKIFDVNGWDVKKVIQHLVKSNAVMLEWLKSGVVYQEDERVVKLLQALGREFFNPQACGWHYLNMAKKKLDLILTDETTKIKNYFYVMRPLACIQYIKEKAAIPYMEYQKNLVCIFVGKDILAEIEKMLRMKEGAKEAEPIKRNLPLIQYFQSEITAMEEWLSEYKFNKDKDFEKADVCFRNIVEMVWADE